MKSHSIAQRTLTLLLGVGAGVYPFQSFALSLGELEVESRLNEALRARIEIVGVSDDEWRQIHAAVAPANYSGDGAEHPEILEAITFRALEDTDHRRFIEVQSREVLTEPLFDLPIQVSAATVQVIRSYSVLLDPAVGGGGGTFLAQRDASEAGDRAPVGAATVAVTGAGGVQSAAPVAQAAKKGVHSRAAKRHRRGAHKRSSSSVAKPQVGHPAQVDAQSVHKSAAEEQLEKQLATLQQTLGEMQATIRAQDSEIANLTRAIAARAQEPVPSRNIMPTNAAVGSDPGSAEEDSASEHESSGSASRIFFWLGGIAALLAAAAAGVRYVRSRKVPKERQVRSDEIRAEMDELSQRMHAQRTSPLAQRMAPVEQAATASSYRAPMDKTQHWGSVPTDSADDSSGLDDWRTQSELLLADIPTDSLPDPDDTLKLEMTGPAAAGAPVRDAAKPGRQPLMSMKDARAPASEPVASNREIVEILESALGVEPGRVDVKLKLLEIYHQEALGNRDNFHALLRKLALDEKSLTPAQRLQIETLRRTLDEGQRDAVTGAAL